MGYTWTDGELITATKLNNTGGGGYDAEVHIYHDNNSAHDYEITIVSGSFADLAAKIDDGINPLVLFRIWDELNFIHVTVFGYLYSYDITSNDKFIMFHAFQLYSSGGDTTGLGYINWAENDEITV